MKQYQSTYSNKKIILFCSRISKEKRPIMMLKIFEKLRKDRDDIILFVVGDGEQLEEMKQEAINLGINESVIFFGMQSDVRIFYKLAKVLVVCSIREGLTLTTYEALSMATPVVSANVGGQSELIDDTCGRIVNNIQEVKDGEISTDYDVEEINNYANAITEIIDAKNYDELKFNCRKKIEDKYTLNLMVEKMKSEIQSLIKRETNVPKEISDNEELYSRYLVLYNEADKRFYNNPRGGVMPEVHESAENRLKHELEKTKTELQQKEEELERKDNELKCIYNSRRWKYIDKIIKILKR